MQDKTTDTPSASGTFSPHYLSQYLVDRRLARVLLVVLLVCCNKTKLHRLEVNVCVCVCEERVIRGPKCLRVRTTTTFPHFLPLTLIPFLLPMHGRRVCMRSRFLGRGSPAEACSRGTRCRQTDKAVSHSQAEDARGARRKGKHSNDMI